MKCYKILHIPSNKYLSKQRNPVRYELTDRGSTWKNKVNLDNFKEHFNIKDLKHIEV